MKKKTIGEIKQEIALKYGYNNWFELEGDANLYSSESYIHRLNEVNNIYYSQFHENT